MSDSIKISLIIPVYGVEDFIAEFAESAFGQTYHDIQYIFVNDGTKDNSIIVLKELIDDRYRHLKDRIIIVDKQNEGLPAARRTGLEYATGEYVWHVDSDDWLELDAVESIVAKIKETDSDVVYFDIIKEYGSRSKVKRDRPHACDAQKEYVSDMFNHRSFGSMCNKCIRKSLYDDHNVIFAEHSYAEDTFLTSQLIGLSSCIAYLDRPLYHYRKTNPGAITRQRIRKKHIEYALNFIRLYDHYKDVPADRNPISSIGGDILIKVGWYSIAYGLGLFSEYPYLAESITNTKISRNSRTSVLIQFFVKSYSRFRTGIRRK